MWTKQNHHAEEATANAISKVLSSKINYEEDELEADNAVLDDDADYDAELDAITKEDAR